MAGLAGCASQPPRLSSLPDYYTGPLTVAQLGNRQLRVDTMVITPAVLRYASATSRLPYYGLTTNEQDPHVFHGAGAHPPATALVVNLPDTLLPPIIATLRQNPALAARLTQAPDAGAILRVRVSRLALLGTETHERECAIRVILQADVTDRSGQPLWHSGLLSTRGDDRNNVSCPQVLKSRAQLSKAVHAELMRVEAGLLDRLSGRVAP